MNVGSVFAILSAKTEGFRSQMKMAGTSLEEFGSKGKRLQDQLKNLERQKQAVGTRLADLSSKGTAAGASFDTLNNRSKNLTDRISTQKQRMDELASSTSRLPDRVNLVGQAFNRLGRIGVNAMSQLLTSIRNVSEIGLGIVLGGAINKSMQALSNFARASFLGTASLQDTRGGFEAMLGSADKAKKLLQDLSDYNKKTPFQLPQLQEQASNLLAVGVSADKIIPTLDMLGKISRGNANRLGFLALAYGQVQSATKLTGAELRQFTENGVPLLELLAKQTGKSTAQIKDDITDGFVTFEMADKALKSTVAEGGRFFNYFEGQSKNFSFVSSNVIDEIQILGRSIMGITETGDVVDGGIFDRVVDATTKLLAFIKENEVNIKSFAGSAVTAFDTALVAVQGLITEVKGLRTQFDNLTAWYNENSAWINSLAIILTSLATGFTLAYGAVALFNAAVVIATNITGLFGIAMAILTSPVFLIGLAIGVLIAIGWLLYANWDEVVKFITMIWEEFPKFLSNLFFSILSFIAKYYMGVIEIWKQLPATFSDLINKTGDFIKNGFATVVASIKGAFDEVGKIDLGKVGQGIIDGLINGINYGVKNLLSAVNGIANAVGDTFKKALGINSPSKLFEKFGKFTAEGYQIGIEKEKLSTAQSTAGLAQSATTGAMSVQQTNSISINGAQNPMAVGAQVNAFLAKQNNLAFNGVT